MQDTMGKVANGTVSDRESLDLIGLTAGYTSQDVVQDVSIRVHSGETVLLTGHNGAGKSCLVETVFGLQPPTSGKVLWRGEDVTGLSPRQLLARGLVLVPQGGGVVKNLTVWENLQLAVPTLASSTASKAGRNPNTAAFAILDQVPILAERRDQIAGSLSGGQMRLLAIARGLLLRPQLLIIDEPFLGLSGASGDLILDLFSKMPHLGGQFGVIVVEQQLFRLTGRIDRYYVLNQGRVVRTGEGSELWTLEPEELWQLS